MNYTIGDNQYTLAKTATPKRISAWLTLHGLKNLSDLFGKTESDKEATVREMTRMSLSMIGDVHSAHQLLQTCLEDEITSETAANADINVIAQIDMDFFFVLIVKLFAPAKSPET